MTTESNRYTSGTSDSRSLNTSNSREHAAALQGAALAFGKVKPNVETDKRRNVALAAATKAGNDLRAISRPLSTSYPEFRLDGVNSPDNPQAAANIGHEAIPEHGIVRRRLNQLVHSEPGDSLQTPRPTASERSRSPSHIAATLAASMSTPSTPSHTGDHPLPPAIGFRMAKVSRRPQSLSRRSSRSETVSDDVPDTRSIPPTNSLIDMFEREPTKQGTSRSSPYRKSNPATATAPRVLSPEIQSPKPVIEQSHYMKETVEPLPVPKQRTSRKAQNIEMKTVRPEMPMTRDEASYNDNDASSDDSFVSAPEVRRPSRPGHSRNQSTASLNPMTVDSLANAIVASSLASSRAASASPSKYTMKDPPPLPPPRRNNTGLFHHHQHHYQQDSRASSPAKGMRQTMRKAPKREEEEDPNMLRRGRKHIMKKPNKHHEGDRKRWRDSVTERERKRYEAVWASNKGLFSATRLIPRAQLPSANTSTSSLLQIQRLDNPEDTVSNIVVKDIWARSRLGEDTLAEVWELVDRSKTGRLAKEEFVVGMWLIDQRLKGRKLPIRVSESVWASVGSLGVRVKENGKKR